MLYKAYWRFFLACLRLFSSLSNVWSKAWYFELSTCDWLIKLSMCCLLLSDVCCLLFIAAARILFHRKSDWLALVLGCSSADSEAGCSASGALVVASLESWWYLSKAALRLNRAETNDWVKMTRINKFIFDFWSTKKLMDEDVSEKFAIYSCSRKNFIHTSDLFAMMLEPPASQKQNWFPQKNSKEHFYILNSLCYKFITR